MKFTNTAALCWFDMDAVLRMKNLAWRSHTKETNNVRVNKIKEKLLAQDLAKKNHNKKIILSGV